MTRIFRYILQHDSGWAPCIEAGALSLATCKTKIRASAQPGDWVLGFRPRPVPCGVLVWAGRIARKVEVGDYEREYRGRRDAVYRIKEGGRFERLQPDYHDNCDDFRKDTTAPVLIFDRDTTWYFGSEPQMMPEHLMHLAAAGRGHRVNGALEEDATTLPAWLSGLSPPGIHGAPRDATG